jgi:hypothetical protein
MGKATEGGFYTAYDDWNCVPWNFVPWGRIPGGPDTGDIGDKGAVWPEAASAAGGIGVLGTGFTGGSIMGNHGVHVAGTGKKGQTGAAQNPERFGVFPVWLGDNTHMVAFGFQDTADQRRRK